MNWSVVQRDLPHDDRGRVNSTLYHVTEQGGSRTLCAHPCTSMDGWREVFDWHPEDVDALDRCGPCYITLEARKRSERENRWQLVAS